jgi:hypothetical protein
MSKIDFGAALEEKTEAPALPDPAQQALVVIDTSPAALVMRQFEKEVELLLAASRDIGVIQDQETNARAVELGNTLKKINKQLQLHQDYFVRPHNEYVKSVRNIFKRFTEPMGTEERNLARKVSDFRRFLENERLRKEAEARRLALELQKKAEDEAKKSADEGAPYVPVALAVPVTPEVPKVTRTAEGSASQRKDWTFKVLDPDKVPRDYMVVDEKLIRKAVKGGVREIPGVEIYEDFITSFRA